MNNWVEKIKDLLTSSKKTHIIVKDNDALLKYPEIIQVFENEGIRVFFAESDIQVRIVFETEVRENSNKCLIVTSKTYKPLPDIEEMVHFTSIGLNILFPNLDTQALKGLSFNALCLLSNMKLYEKLGHDQTLKFLLENLYSVDFDSLRHSNSKERIINALIMVFLEKNGVNAPLSEFLENLAKPYFPNLLKTGFIKNNLIDFLQEQWANFVNEKEYYLDFNETILKRNLGYLFAFGYLKPVKVTEEKYRRLSNPLKMGVFINEQGDNDTELEGLIEYLHSQIESIEDLYDQWFKIIQIIASTKLKAIITTNKELKEKFAFIENIFNLRFQRFIDNTYNSLFSLSGVRRPVVVSRILDYIKAQPEEKKALIVIDGMNYWQWLLLGKELSDEKIKYDLNSTLAYIPTITAWSRQAIFKGDKPDLKEDNSKEAKLFNEYWTNQGISSYKIEYNKTGLNQKFSPNNLSPDISILGLVCNDLDDIMHGSLLGEEQLRTSTIQWIKKSGIIDIISSLMIKGFCIYLTSDHGSIEATGVKNLSLKERVGTLSRSKRHLYFANDTMQKTFIEDNASIAYGIKNQSIYLKNNEAFTIDKHSVITHGGSHFWEVLVPFVRIYEK